jgi:hypothetical protein
MQSLPPLHDENNSIIQNVIPEEIKWKQPLPFTDLFSRRFDLNDFELAGLLAHLLFETFPPRMVRAVACGQKVLKAYSCGYSSGIAPDSLFRRFPNREVGHQDATKVENF